MQLPTDFSDWLQNKSKSIHNRTLDIFIAVRNWRDDNEHLIPSAQDYHEAIAAATGWAEKTVEAKLNALRAYDESTLRQWFEHGITFDHLQKANWVTSIQGTKHFENPFALLDDAVTIGGASGKTMTVKEMESFALGETMPRPKTARIINILSGWLDKLTTRLGVTGENAKILQAKIADLLEFVKGLE